MIATIVKPTESAKVALLAAVPLDHTGKLLLTLTCTIQGV